MSWSLLIALAASAAPAARAKPAPPRADDAAFQETVKPFLARNCYACHNEGVKIADVDLEAYDTAEALVRDPATWEKAAVKMRTLQMPPSPMPRPDEAEVARIASWIDTELDRANRAAAPDPGRVTAHRLNRTEYDNTVRDLLGVTLHAASDFPQDDSGYGFDNVADVLSLSPVLMEKYMAAAEKVTRAALFGLGDLQPTLVRLQPPGAAIEPRLRALTDYDTSGLSLPNALHVTHRFPVEAEYRFRVVLGGARPARSEEHTF